MKDIMLNYYKHIALPACLAIVFGMPLAAQAADPAAGDNTTSEQKQGAAPGKNAGKPGSSQVDQKTKEKFVGAYIEIKDVQQKYTKKLEKVNDEEKARELQKQAQAEMVEIVKSNDMSVNEYNQVVGAISSDPELRMEIEKMAKAEKSN